MQTTRAKFRCNFVTDHGGKKSVDLTPVYGDTPENKTFWAATPSGKLELTWINPNVSFEPGKEYFLDITAAEAPATA